MLPAGPQLDPTVWAACINAQLQRPPSRQKPPPEALHLWSPDQHRNQLAAQQQVRGGEDGC